MPNERLISHFLALAQTLDGHTYGFNYYAIVHLNDFSDEAMRLIQQTFSALDHKSLGLDVNWIQPASTPQIAKWIFDTLAAQGVKGVSQITLRRGDGVEVSYWQP